MILTHTGKSSHLAQYVRMFCELHLLNKSGLGGTETADRLRDEMDLPWRRLIADDHAILDKLAIDMSRLGEGHPEPKTNANETECQLRLAVDASDWELALAIVREQEPSLRPIVAAVVRAIGWTNLGYPSAAPLFFAEAVRLRPDDIRYKSMYWRALLRAERGEEAKRFAEQALRSSTNAYEVALAADVLFDWAAGQPDEHAGPVFGRIVETVTADSSKTAAFDESVELVGELHRLTLGGLDESEAGDAIREAMEARWWTLDTRQQRLVRGLSADLYSIGAVPPRRSSPSDGGPAAFSNAVQAGKWDEALDLLRKHQAAQEPASLASLRGICWTRLHRPDIAALFFAEAARISPDDPIFRHMYWRALIQANQFEEASKQARLAIQSSGDPYVLFAAADALLDCALMRGSANQDMELEGVLQIVARAKGALKETPQEGWLRDLVYAAQLNRAICYDILGDSERAEQAAAEAQALVPTGATAAVRSDSEFFRQDLESRRCEARRRLEAGMVVAAA